MALEESVLKTVKFLVGVPQDSDVFDDQLITYINTAFSNLAHLGIGPSAGFMILDDEATWSDFYGSDMHLNSVQSYVGEKVRMMFDPPSTSFAIAAKEKIIAELEWRLNAYRDELAWVEPVYPPDLDLLDEDDFILDGGSF